MRLSQRGKLFQRACGIPFALINTKAWSREPDAMDRPLCVALHSLVWSIPYFLGPFKEPLERLRPLSFTMEQHASPLPLGKFSTTHSFRPHLDRLVRNAALCEPMARDAPSHDSRFQIPPALSLFQTSLVDQGRAGRRLETVPGSLLASGCEPSSKRVCKLSLTYAVERNQGLSLLSRGVRMQTHH
jgi:hypothetical protein